MKNKKLITAVILLIIALFATCYSLQKYNDENDFIVTVHDKTIEINGYKGTKTDVNIPPRIGKLPVTAIGHNAFWNKKINHVIIPNTVTKIGDGAFAFNDITEIVLPDRITEIGYEMFYNNKLTSIKIPETVVTIGGNAFNNNMLTELIIPKSVISIGRSAFNNNITKVTIGDNVELDLHAIRKFDYFYDYMVRKRGGTYIYSDHYWRPEDKSIPVYVFDPEKGWKSPDIEFLPDMPDLEEVTLRDNDLLTDITPLSELTKIKTLRIGKCPDIKSIKPLSSLVNMESLSLTHNNNYDYRDIAPLQKLERLAIGGYHSGEIDLGSIGQLHYLKFLVIYLTGTTFKNINELQNMTNLETLIIKGVDNLDLSWAANLHNLTELRLDDCTVKDLSPLANLPNLVEVDLQYSHIKDITPLLRSNSLKYVRVYEHDVEGGISDTIRSRFQQKDIHLDTFYDYR